MADVNALVSDYGRRRVMVLGLPLIQVLTVSELEAVIAHEFGHYAGGDTRQAWVYRTREKIGRTLATLRRGWRLLRLPILLYGRLFMRVRRPCPAVRSLLLTSSLHGLWVRNPWPAHCAPGCGIDGFPELLVAGVSPGPQCWLPAAVDGGLRYLPRQSSGSGCAGFVDRPTS